MFDVSHIFIKIDRYEISTDYQPNFRVNGYEIFVRK